MSDRKKQKEEVLNLMMSENQEDRILGFKCKQNLRVKFDLKDWKVIYGLWKTHGYLYQYMIDDTFNKSPIKSVNSYYKRWAIDKRE